MQVNQHIDKIPLADALSLRPKEKQSNPKDQELKNIWRHKNIEKAEKKKFKTRIRQFNPQSSNCLISSYDHESHAHYEAISSREKNNIAARTSRKRKKMYIELLEEQNTNLELELYQINQQIEMQRTQIFNAIMHTDELNSKNGEIQSLVTKKLTSLAQMPRNLQNDTEINICLDSCIYRIGASGSERRAILDILYKGFINRNLPNNYRFILWAAIHRFQIYETDKNNGFWWEFIKSDLMKRFQDFFAAKGHKLQEKGKEILKCSKQILNIKRQIEEAGQLYDRFIKEIREILTPTQSAQLFLFADRATPKPELQLFQEKQQKINEDSCEIISPVQANFSKKFLISLQNDRNPRKIIQQQKISNLGSFKT